MGVTRFLRYLTAPVGDRPGASTLARRLIAFELIAVLAVSYGQSGVSALLSLVDKLTKPQALSSQAVYVAGTYVQDRHWLDLLYQLNGIVFGLAPVLLVAYLLLRSSESVRAIGFDLRRPGGDLARGAILAALVGGTGLGLYVLALAVGINATVVASSIGDYWYAVPVLVGSAIQNAIGEEVVVLGFVLHRLDQAGVGRSKALIFSALLRGSYHLYQGFGGFLGNVAMGLFFGAIFQRSRRCMPMVIAHALIDITAFVGYHYLAQSGHVGWLQG